MLKIKCKGEKILKKKKIAVLSIYDLDNFGNRLQSVAVYKLLKKVNCEPEIVEIDKIGKKELISRLLKKTLRFSEINFESVRLPLFRKFNKNIKISKYKIQWFLGKEVVDKGMDDAYDFFIVGSDQVWNPEFAGDGFYFLDFVKENKKKIAFSASVGVTDISKNYEDKMRLNLKKFNDKIKYLLVDIILIIFGFIVGYPAAIKRCIIFFVINSINKLFHLNINSFKVLLLVIFCLILYNYKIIFDVGFLYSVCTVLGIILCNDFISHSNKIVTSFRLSLIAFLFSLPISLCNFYEVNLLSIIYNMFYIRSTII